MIEIEFTIGDYLHEQWLNGLEAADRNRYCAPREWAVGRRK